jgi:integrase
MPSANPVLRGGIYYFRLKVPLALRPLVGRAEEKASLETRSLAVAKRLFAVRENETRKRWKALEDKAREEARARSEAESRLAESWALEEQRPVPEPRALSVVEANMIARQFYEWDLANFQAGFSPWQQFARSLFLQEYVEDRHFADAELQEGFDQIFGELVDAYLAMHEIVLESSVRRFLNMCIAKATLQAAKQNFRILDGDCNEDPDLGRFPVGEFNPLVVELSISSSFEKFARDRKLAPLTVKRWRGVIRHLVAFIGHDDIRRLEHSAVLAWRNHLLDSRSRQAVTVQDVYIAALRATLKHLVSDGVLKENPAARVEVTLPRNAKERKRSFTNDEAKKILNAALSRNERIGRTQANARRWVPWICAYTGARVNEITQLRRCDIEEKDGVWVFNIRPEAGAVKGGRPRLVPIHPHLIEQGFLEFARGKGPDAMFYNARRVTTEDDREQRYRKTGERIARWVRKELHIEDERVGPNHGWRHRYKTISRRYKLDSLIVDAIQGHSFESVSAEYGEIEVEVMLREMELMPWYDIDVVPRTRGG